VNSRFVTSLLCAGAIAIACTARPRSEDVAAAPARAQAVDGHPKIKSFLNVEHRDDGVRLALHVVNTGKSRVEIDFPDGQTYDFVVLDSTGRKVWEWAKARFFTQSTQVKYVGGGDAFEVAEQWRNPPAPGKYVAVATLRSTNFPVTERVPFTVR
jgi:hypothetical protein